MSDKFTPGPWRWWACKGGDQLPSSDYVQIASGNDRVAQVKIASVTEANIRLIVAAPELLEVLKHAVEALEACQGTKLKDSFPLTLADARAVIAKATGVQP